jgi:hypothetical protein
MDTLRHESTTTEPASGHTVGIEPAFSREQVLRHFSR